MNPRPFPTLEFEVSREFSIRSLRFFPRRLAKSQLVTLNKFEGAPARPVPLPFQGDGRGERERPLQQDQPGVIWTKPDFIFKHPSTNPKIHQSTVPGEKGKHG